MIHEINSYRYSITSHQQEKAIHMRTSGFKLQSIDDTDLESVIEDNSINTLEELGKYIIKSDGKKEKKISWYARIITDLIFARRKPKTKPITCLPDIKPPIK
jgi:hypothetical protein